MAAQAKRSRALTIAKAAGTAAKAILPTAVTGLGSLVGTLAARWAAARISPTRYAKSAAVPLLAGIGGTVVGGAIPLALITSTRTKSQAEKAYKATIPLGLIGMSLVALATSIGPYVWGWLKSKLPTTMNTASATPANRQLVGAVVGSKAQAKQLAAAGATAPVASREAAISRGLDPRQWDRLERRAAGLRPSQRRALESGTARKVRYAV